MWIVIIERSSDNIDILIYHALLGDSLTVTILMILMIVTIIIIIIIIITIIIITIIIIIIIIILLGFLKRCSWPTHGDNPQVCREKMRNRSTHCGISPVTGKNRTVGQTKWLVLSAKETPKAQNLEWHDDWSSISARNLSKDGWDWVGKKVQ